MMRAKVRRAFARMVVAGLLAMAGLLLMLTVPHQALAESTAGDVISAELSASGRLDVTEMRSNAVKSSYHYASWGVFAEPKSRSGSINGDQVHIGTEDVPLIPADVTVVAVYVRPKGESDFQPLEQVEYTRDRRSTLEKGDEPEGQGWMFDAERRRLYVFGSFKKDVDVLTQYYSDSAIWFGSDCVYLPWGYSVDQGSASIGSYSLDLKLPVDASAAPVAGQPLQGFVYADENNCLTFKQESDSSAAAAPSSAAASTSTSSSSSSASSSTSSASKTSSSLKDEAYYRDGAVHVTTTASFPKPTGTTYSAQSLCLNLVMPRSWFAEDAAGTMMVRTVDGAAPSYDDLVKANKSEAEDIIALKNHRAKSAKTSSSKTKDNSTANALNSVLNGFAWFALIFLVGGFVLALVLVLIEYVYERRPDPRTDVEPTRTNKVPDRTIHPLVFDELFYHEYDPEVRDFETEMLRLAALGFIEVGADGEGDSAIPYISRGDKQPFDPIDNYALGLVFGGAATGDQTLSAIKSRFSDDPRKIDSLFKDWKKKITERADESSYMQERVPYIARVGGTVIALYVLGSTFVAMMLGWLVVLLAVGAGSLLLYAQKSLKSRIVLTEEGARLCALGKGYCEWLENASPEEILDTDDERELADRLTYMAVFARDSWGPEKIEQVTALRPDDPRMRSVRACYCPGVLPAKVLRTRSVAKDVSSFIETATAFVEANPKASGPKPSSGDKELKSAAPAEPVEGKDESANFVPAMAASVATAAVSTDAEKQRQQAERKVRQAKLELKKCENELSHARAAEPPGFDMGSDEEENIMAKSVKQALPSIIGLTIVMVMGLSMLRVGSYAAVVVLFSIVVAASNVVHYYRINSREQEAKDQANEQARKLAEDRYKAQKDSIPLLERRLEECKQEYEQALEELNSL